MSADALDDASDQEQQHRDRSIAAARVQAQQPVKTVYYSHCGYCFEPTPDGRRYCSYGADSCATDARWRQDILTRQGR